MGPKVILGIAVCLIILMIKSTYQARIIMAVALIGLLLYTALNKKR